VADAMDDDDVDVDCLSKKDLSSARARIRKCTPGVDKGGDNDAEIGLNDASEEKQQKNT
jgi:hypothetical protein